MYRLGEKIVFTLYGESHGECIGGMLDGIPKGLDIDFEMIDRELALRKPTEGIGTPRTEPDVVELISGIWGGKTTGERIHYRIANKNTDSSKYDIFNKTPRPGHADLPALVKDPDHVIKGGNQFSGRLTVSVVVAGSIARQMLALEGITVAAYTRSIGKIKDDGERTIEDAIHSKRHITRAATKELDSKMTEEIISASFESDSVGGTIECITTGLPIGFGGTWFESLDAEIARAVFGIPACKGIEFGKGFSITEMKGSESNDPYYYDNGFKLRTNNMGGILGGMSDGAPMVFRVAFKPTPSIGKEQDTVDLEKMENAKVIVQGNHDPCIVPRAVIVVESVTCLVLADQMTRGMDQIRSEDP
jgi:chorismate synthase